MSDNLTGRLNASDNLSGNLQVNANWASKVDKYQGAENVGKSLVVGSDGMVTVGDSQIEVDSALSGTSTNPVQNKVIKQALDNIEIDVDSALSDTSENPVQNKVVKGAVDRKVGVDSQTFTDAQKAQARQNINAVGKAALALTNRRVDALYKINEGQTYDWDVDTAEAYSVDVPSGAVADSVKMIGGKTVVWNQLVKNGKPESDLYWRAYSTVLSFNNGVIEASWATTTGYPGATCNNSSFPKTEIGHKYYVTVDAKAETEAEFYAPYTSFGYSEVAKYKRVGPSWVKLENIVTATEITNVGVGARVHRSSAPPNTIFLKNAMIIDLTKMFGAGNEPTTVEEFKAMFPKDYYEYNEGELVSAGVKEVEVKDANSVITNRFQIPSAIQALPGYGWSAGSVYNEVDYANKKYIQRVGSVNLGSLTWSYQSNYQRFLTYGIKNVCKPSATESAYANITCVPYSTGGAYNISLSAYNKTVAINTGGDLLIRDESYTDAASFKSAMSGVYLRYELATPVEIDISDMLEEGFLEAMAVESGGSVTFVSDTEDKYRLPVPNTNEYVVKLSEV